MNRSRRQLCALKRAGFSRSTHDRRMQRRRPRQVRIASDQFCHSPIAIQNTYRLPQQSGRMHEKLTSVSLFVPFRAFRG